MKSRQPAAIPLDLYFYVAAGLLKQVRRGSNILENYEYDGIRYVCASASEGCPS